MSTNVTYTKKEFHTCGKEITEKKNGNCLFWFSSSGKFVKKKTPANQFQSQTQKNTLFFHMSWIYFSMFAVACFCVDTCWIFSTKIFLDQKIRQGKITKIFSCIWLPSWRVIIAPRMYSVFHAVNDINSK